MHATEILVVRITFPLQHDILITEVPDRFNGHSPTIKRIGLVVFESNFITHFNQKLVLN